MECLAQNDILYIIYITETTKYLRDKSGEAHRMTGEGAGGTTLIDRDA